jgi:hypothetical protein
VVRGEDNCLAESVAARDLQSVRHQGLQGLVDGVGVEEIFVQLI